MYKQWYHNESPTPTKAKIRWKKTHTHVNSWHTELGFRAGASLAVRASLPLVSATSQLQTGVNLQTGDRDTVTDTEQFSVTKEITIEPGTSVMVEWILTDFVQVRAGRQRFGLSVELRGAEVREACATSGYVGHVWYRALSLRPLFTNPLATFDKQ